MNALNICLIAAALVVCVTSAEESHQVDRGVERVPTTIWDEFNEELRNATLGTKQFMKYGIKAAVETLKSTILNEVEILNRLHNTEAVTVRSALLKISDLIDRVEQNIIVMNNLRDFNVDVTTFSTDGLEILMQRIQLLNELLDTLSKLTNTIIPPPNESTTIKTTTRPSTTSNPTTSSTLTTTRRPI